MRHTSTVTVKVVAVNLSKILVCLATSICVRVSDGSKIEEHTQREKKLIPKSDCVTSWESVLQPLLGKQ